MSSKIALVACFLVALNRASPPPKKYQPPYSFVMFQNHLDNAKRIRSVADPELPVKSVQVLPTPVPTVVTPVAFAEPVAVRYEEQEPVQYAVERQVVPQYSIGIAGHYGKSYGHREEEHDYAPPKYEYSYGVEDHVTGDIHSHREARDGDVTQGEYSLHEADGTVRTVKYTVNGKSGFNAIVERTAQQHHHQ